MPKKDLIESLTPLEHVRLRPGMYAGDTSNANQLLLEAFANALDMYAIGYGKRIEVYTSGSHIEVIDYAKGFPINEKREDGLTTLEASFSVINTSGKYHDDGLYEGTSLGLNGIGAKICTFLSHELQVSSCQNGNYEKLKFVEGVLESRDVGYNEAYIGKDGTTVKFDVSEEFFTDPTVNEKFFTKFFNDIACLCPDLEIVFNDDVIAHPQGIVDFVSSQVKDDIEIVNNRLYISDESNGQKLSLGLTYSSNSNCKIVPYVNYGLTESGPHITSVKTAITRVLNNWARENGLLKEKDKNLDGSSLQEGLVLVFNLITQKVGYNAQVKNQIVKIDTSFVNGVFSKQFEMWLDNNPEDAINIIEKALIARQAAEAAKRARQRVKDNAAKKEKVFKLPTTLTDCWSKDRGKCELIICEGKSAASGLVAARDSEYQAVYGVRGKMLSVLKATPEKILSNQEINNLIQALGLECDNRTATLKYDKSKLRYGKIIACADADPDGSAIENLLFNILWYLCPDLITEGHVYSAVPPLFRVTTNKNEYIYFKDQKELSEYTSNHKNEKYVINRNKGLGEQDQSELSDTLLDPKTRNVLKLVVEDFGKTDKLFEDLYGKKVEPRVEFLLKHSEEAEYSYE